MNEYTLFHDLALSPVSQHSVWSEITHSTKREQFIALNVGPCWP